jgi:hypothetical protein
MRILAQKLYPRHLSYLVHPGTLYVSSPYLVLISFLQSLAPHLVSHPSIEILSVMCCNIGQRLFTLFQNSSKSETIGHRFKINSSQLRSGFYYRYTPPSNFFMGSLLNDDFLDSHEQCGSGPNLENSLEVNYTVQPLQRPPPLNY